MKFTTDPAGLNISTVTRYDSATGAEALASGSSLVRAIELRTQGWT